MKKKILLFMLLVPVVTFAATCDPIVNNVNTNSRDITCDASKSTVTTFRTENEIEVLKNEVCTIKCKEEILFSVDPIKRVLAGTGFNYPLYASGKRNCTAEYKYTEYETKIRTLVNEYNSLTDPTEKETKKREIVNYYENKKECDGFTSDDESNTHKYKFNGNVELKLSTSQNEETIPYYFSQIGEYSKVVDNDEVNVTPMACNFDEATITCKLSNKTIKSWNETVMLNGKYTMKDTYLELNTGNIESVYRYDRCNAGDKYFTSFNEYTRPVAADPTDRGYSLVLTARNLGNNLILGGDAWNLNVNCSYKVKNLSFPITTPGAGTDENYDKYGGEAFQYRIIDVNNPFPNREPSANWSGLTPDGKTLVNKYITSTSSNLSTMERFVITLDRSKIGRVRDYNKNHSYDTFNIDEMNKSKFIIANPDIIDRK